jgi:hypothetical protein
MTFDYATYVATLANMTGYGADDPNFVQILPSVINYAEGRIYREADFISTVIRDTGTLTANSRNFTLPSNVGTFNVVRQMNAITPANADPSSGTRNPMTPVSTEVMDMLWPSDTAPSTPSIPTMFAMLTQNNVEEQMTDVLVGPAPDDEYNVEVIGTVNPTPLSASNPTTYLTLFLPDLFLAASMVFMTGFQKNFGAQSDDPKMAQSWESQYQVLFKSADLVDSRQRFAAASWTSAQPENFASAQRG